MKGKGEEIRIHPRAGRAGSRLSDLYPVMNVKRREAPGRE